MQAPPARPVRLVEDDASAQASAGDPSRAAEGSGHQRTRTQEQEQEQEHVHEHVHADGTRHRHAHAHPHDVAHEHPAAHAHSHAHVHEHVHADGTRHSHSHEHTHDRPHEHPESHQHSHNHGTATESGAGAGGRALIEVHQPILARNARLAERNRGYLKAKGVRALNLLSSPGAGKTTLIERTVSALGDEARVAVVVGDLATANDATRIREAGAPVVQITTGTVCHLDAEMVARGIEQLDLDRCAWLFVENVGNLVCPADFDLGEDLRVVLLSVTEGEDKPLKYPPIFRSADAVVVTKLDLATATGADLPRLRQNLRATAPGARVFELSARTGDGLSAWLDWLRGARSGERA